MIRKSITFVFILLMLSPLFVMTNQVALTSTQNITSENMYTVAETDLDRVDWEANIFPNGGLEEWNNPHSPRQFFTQRSEETDAWIDSTIFIEGSHSIGLEARAIDQYHSVDVYLVNQTQGGPWYTPLNYTLDLDWYLDSIGTPVNQDYIRIDVDINYKHLYYYLGCETEYTNYTNNRFFEIDGTLQTWNHLHRNLTSDYYDAFGELPTQFRDIRWDIHTSTANVYTRVFFDDFNLGNETVTVSESGFEVMGLWQTGWHYGAGDIAQCSDSHSGSSSMNLTTITFDDKAWAEASRHPETLLSVDNQANLSFWWKLDEYVNPSTVTHARVAVSVENATFYSTIYYYLFVGGSGTLPMINFGNDMKFAVANFNVTDTWNFFDRSIWEDFTSIYNTENLWIDQIEFQVTNNEDDARLSLLVDDIVFAPSILNDMGYERQNAVGEPIQGWDTPGSVDDFTVTEFAASGSKAANLTLVDNYIYEDQQLNDHQIDATTEFILDFNVYIDTFNTSSEDYVLFELYFDDLAFSYIIANSTSAFEDEIGGEEDAKFIILQDTLVTGEWLNFQLDVVHDYELLYGTLPNTTIYEITLMAEAVAGSELTIFFDDLYIYYDVAPEIIDVNQSPVTVDEAGEVVGISAEVTDASELTVTLSYRIDSGAWINLTMNETTNGNYTVDINAPYGVTEYFVTAEDAFSKTDTAMDGGDYFTFTTDDTVDPVITLTPANGSTVSDIVSIQIEVADAGSGFAGAELFIEGASITNVTLDTIGISWDTTIIPDGDYRIMVVAEDNAGNTATVTHIVTVENTAAPTGDLSGVILIAVIIAAVGIVFVIYIFVIKKK